MIFSKINSLVSIFRIISQIKSLFCVLALLLISEVASAQFPTGGGFPPTGGGGSGFPSSQTNGGFPQRGSQQNQPRQKKTGKKLDDSTKVIYGPKSTRYFLEADVVNNRKTLYTIDTVVDGVHNYSLVSHSGNLYQDLGNVGTAIRPVFYKAPEKIGTLLGYDSYLPYMYRPDQIPYFFTKSPFSNIRYVLGGSGQNVLDFDLTRNIDSLWNVGFNLRRMTAEKQLVAPGGGTGLLSNNLVGQWTFVLHSNYQTRNKKYQVMGNVSIFDYNTSDQGGLKLAEGSSYESILESPIGFGSDAILQNASTRDKSTNWHIYHEYVLDRGFQLFQSIDYQSRRVQFNDLAYKSGLDNKFYPKTFLSNVTDKDSLYNDNDYTNLEQKSGIKGFYRGFNYRAHIRNRYLTLNYFDSYNNPNYKNFENYIGLWLNQNISDSTRFWGEFETLVGATFSFKVKGEFQSKFLTLGGNFMSSLPTLAQERMSNNSFAWYKNNFKNVLSNTAYLVLNKSFGKVKLTPTFEINQLSNHIYFDTSAVVKQTAKVIVISRAGLGMEYRKGKFSTVNQVFLNYSSEDASELKERIVRMPNVLINSRIAFDLLYAKVLYIQTGLEFHYKSGYYADAFMPATQQFYQQNKASTNDYPLVDAFADLRINRVRVFVKLSNLGSGIVSNGYYTSQGWTGMGRTFAFGVKWLLFD
jgi:Putative porin